MKRLDTVFRSMYKKLSLFAIVLLCLLLSPKCETAACRNCCKFAVALYPESIHPTKDKYFLPVIQSRAVPKPLTLYTNHWGMGKHQKIAEDVKLSPSSAEREKYVGVKSRIRSYEADLYSGCYLHLYGHISWSGL